MEEEETQKKREWTLKLKLKCYKPMSIIEVSEIIIDSLKHNFHSGKVLLTKP